MMCPICEKRPPKRFCPAKGEKICAVCCGEGREVTIDCPLDCSYLISAHRYEAEHRAPMKPEEYPYKDVRFDQEFVFARWPFVTGIASVILNFYAQNKDLTDPLLFSALEALAETTRTMDSGIIYEHPPDSPTARNLYARIADYIRGVKKQELEKTGQSTIKDADVFRLLVFLLRVCKRETNGRPRCRSFIAFLRVRFPAPAEPVAEAPRIIIP
jgi:hypothetical protein